MGRIHRRQIHGISQRFGKLLAAKAAGVAKLAYPETQNGKFAVFVRFEILRNSLTPQKKIPSTLLRRLLGFSAILRLFEGFITQIITQSFERPEPVLLPMYLHC